MTVSLATGICLSLLAAQDVSQAETPRTLRWMELNGDDYLDRLESFADGTQRISIGVGLRGFQPIEQELPRLAVTDVLVEDLNGDGLTDLYLITPGENIALIGDGSGLFREATDSLGLRDEGVGQSAEWRDADADGQRDLLLHNLAGDVLFWGVPGGFERDASTPFVAVAFVGASSLFGASVGTPSERESALGPVGEERVVQRRQVEVGERVLVTNATPGSHSSGTNDSLPLASSVPIVGPAVPIVPDRGAPKLLIGVTPEQQEILGHQSIVQLPDGLGGTVKTLRISGINVQIVNGLGATNGNPGAPNSLVGTTNGLGNLIVGYNELGNPAGDKRGGSHNVVIGHGHTYRMFGGLVAGQDNSLNAAYATVSGGHLGIADGLFSSISGGRANTVINEYTLVSGGRYNVASLYGSSVAGGAYNSATGTDSIVSGGNENIASGTAS